jgi:uncharacterized protein (TIGR02266 family)
MRMPEVDHRFFPLLLSSARLHVPGVRVVEKKGQEARRSPRFALRKRVWCEGDHVTLYLQSQNVSAGGFFLRTATPLPPGTRDRVSLRIEEVEMIADAEVVWVAGVGAHVPGMGLKLLEIREGAEAFEGLLSHAAATS